MTSTGRPIHPVGVGIVGAGSAARQHLAAMLACPEAVPVAVCDSDPAAVSALLAEHPSLPGLRGLPDLDAMLADECVELIAVATPPGSHAPLALQALAGGRAVLLEKPPLLTIGELHAVIAAADARGLVTGVMLQHRFRLPRPAVNRPWTGAATASLEVVRYRPPGHYARAVWRTDPRDSGGGLVAHLGVHYLDLACQLLGVPAEISASIDAVQGTQIDQRVAFTAQFADGARLAFIGTTGVDRRSERLAVYDADRSLVVTDDSTTYSADTSTTRPAPGTASLRSEVYGDVARAVREGRRPAVADLHGTRGVVTLIEMLHAAGIESVAA